MAKRSEISGKYTLYSEYLKEKIEDGEIPSLPATALKPEVIQVLIRSYTGFQKSEANREFNASVSAARAELDGEEVEEEAAPPRRRKKAAAAPAKKAARTRKAAAAEPEPEEENGEEEEAAPPRRGRPRKGASAVAGKRTAKKAARRKPKPADPVEEVDEDEDGYAEF